MLAVDMSQSMRATDVEPTRIQAAQRAVRAFVDSLPKPVPAGARRLRRQCAGARAAHPRARPRARRGRQPPAPAADRDRRSDVRVDRRHRELAARQGQAPAGSDRAPVRRCHQCRTPQRRGHGCGEEEGRHASPRSRSAPTPAPWSCRTKPRSCRRRPAGRDWPGRCARSSPRSARSTYWTLLVLLAVSIGIGAAICAGTAANWNQTSAADRATFDATQVSIAGLFYLGQLVIVVFGAIVLTARYSTGMTQLNEVVEDIVNERPTSTD